MNQTPTPMPLHIPHQLRSARDRRRAVDIAVRAASVASGLHPDFAVEHIIVPVGTHLDIVSVEGPAALLTSVSVAIAGITEAVAVVAASRTAEATTRIELYDSAGLLFSMQPDEIILSPIGWRLPDGVSSIATAQRTGHASVADAVNLLIAEIKAAAKRGRVDIEAHLVSPTSDGFGIVSIVSPGSFSEPSLLLQTARAAAAATSAAAIVWSLPDESSDDADYIEVEYPGDRIERLHLQGLDPVLVPSKPDDDCTWWTLPDNCERAKIRGVDCLNEV